MPAIVVLMGLGAAYFWLHGKLSHVGEAPAAEVEQVVEVVEQAVRPAPAEATREAE